MDVRPARDLPRRHPTPAPVPGVAPRLRPPACDAANSPASAGVTGTSTTHSISVARSRQSVGGRSHRGPCKTKNSRRCIDLDPHTETILARWRRRQHATATRPDSTIRSSRTPQGAPVHPESISQLFTRQLARIDLPTIRFHDLRHTHASLLSPLECRSRSCPNGSATPIPASRWPPTNTSCPAWAPPPPAGFRRADIKPDEVADRRLPVRIRKRPVHGAATRQPVDDPVDVDPSPPTTKARNHNDSGPFSWWRGQDLNLRPSGYERSEPRPARIAEFRPVALSRESRDDPSRPFTEERLVRRCSLDISLDIAGRAGGRGVEDQTGSGQCLLDHRAIGIGQIRQVPTLDRPQVQHLEVAYAEASLFRFREQAVQPTRSWIRGTSTPHG